MPPMYRVSRSFPMPFLSTGPSGGRVGGGCIIPGSALFDLGDVQLEQVVQPAQELLSV